MSSFLYIALFAAGIVLLSAGERLGARLPKPVQTTAAKMSKISWGIYLNHTIVIDVFKFFTPKYQPITLPLYLLALTAYSMLTMAVVDRIMRLLHKAIYKNQNVNAASKSSL